MLIYLFYYCLLNLIRCCSSKNKPGVKYLFSPISFSREYFYPKRYLIGKMKMVCCGPSSNEIVFSIKYFICNNEWVLSPSATSGFYWNKIVFFSVYFNYSLFTKKPLNNIISLLFVFKEMFDVLYSKEIFFISFIVFLSLFTYYMSNQ